MAKKKKQITDARIDFISLCPVGKNRLATLYKEDGGIELAGPIVKADPLGEGTLTALAYVPGMEDTDGHQADQDVVRQMAYSFSRTGQGVDIRHNNKALPKEAAFVAESFIVAKGDERFADVKDRDGNSVDCEGAWAVVIKMEDARLKRLYASEGWEGISVGGHGLLQDIDEDTDAESLVKAFRDILLNKNSGTLEGATSTEPEEELEMKPEEVKKLVEESLEASLTKALPDVIAKAVADAVKPKEEPKKKVDVALPEDFDPLDKEDVLEHARRVRAANVDWTDADSIGEYVASLEKAEKTKGRKKAKSAQRTDFEKADDEDQTDLYFTVGAESAKAYKEG